MDVNYYLKRKLYLEDRTLGDLYRGDQLIANTLEDRVRPDGEKVYGETAIPAGQYRMIVNYSNRFKKQMIQIINVRGNGVIRFGATSIDACGIRIHGGNTPEDTAGCILVGEKVDTANHTIFDCHPLAENLKNQVMRDDEQGEVYLYIVNKTDVDS